VSWISESARKIRDPIADDALLDVVRRPPVDSMPMSDAARSILWRRLDRAGHEAARVFRAGAGWRLEGAAVFAHEGAACRLDYDIACDAGWQTVSCRVTGWTGVARIDIDVRADGARRWRVNGAECPAVAGAIDIDLNWSPSTNLLPIRRLGLAVGTEGPVTAAWLRFPGFALEPLAQTYRRLAPGVYRYESGGGRFTADLDVDDAGLVTRYPGFCEAETGAP